MPSIFSIKVEKSVEGEAWQSEFFLVAMDVVDVANLLMERSDARRAANRAEDRIITIQPLGYIGNNGISNKALEEITKVCP